MSSADRKQLIRDQIKMLRANVDKKMLESAGSLFADFIEDESGDGVLKGLSASGKTFALYKEMPGEFPVSKAASWLAEQGVRCCYPRTCGGVMKFYEALPEDEKSFEKGAYGILQPVSGLKEVKAEEIDVAVVPGVAYNYEGYRLGMGGGYYDRFFEGAKALLVAPCFDFQLYSAIPVESHDLCVDILLPFELEKEDAGVSQ